MSLEKIDPGKNIVIPTNNLVLAGGLTREQIEERLGASGFTFCFLDTERKGYYFRQTPVSAHGPYDKVRSSLIRDLGEPTSEQAVRGWGRKPVMAYQALWEITPEFDIKALDGPISFRRGNLVERTFFYFL